MEKKIHLSHETILALQQLKSVLDSKLLSLEQLLNIKNIHSNQLSRKEFIAFISEFTQMKPQHIFKQLSGKNHVVCVSDLNMIMSKLEKTTSQNHEIHTSKKLKQKNNKNQIQTVIQKLRQYLARLPNSMAFLLQFDFDKNGYIDQFEFNNMLMATGIRYFHFKKIRKLVVESIFKQFGKVQISFSELFHYFGIKENANMQQEQKKSTLPSQNNREQPHKPQLPLITILQKQESKIADIKNTYPLSIQYYWSEQLYEQEVLKQLQELLKKNIKFIDIQNPKIQKGIYVPAAHILNGIYYIFKSQRKLLFSQSRILIANKLKPSNVKQGLLQDCYFISCIASLLSKHPNIIIQKFLLNTNPSNFYAIKLFINGEWKIITTDDYFPCEGNSSIYAKPHKNDIWVMLLEKVWAKEFGSYKKIEKGLLSQAFMALTGAPYEIHQCQKWQKQAQAIQLFENIQKQNYVASMVSKNKQGLGQQGQKLGLVAEHAYSFLKKINVNGENLIQIRNPWGHTKWEGDWSFICKKWTQQLRDLYNYNQNLIDGSFYISFSDFRKYFNYITICKGNPSFEHDSIRAKTTRDQSAYFLMQVKKSGKYTVSVYQPSSRKMKLQYPNYQYSQARIVVLKDQGEEMIYIDSNFTRDDQVCSVEMELQEGEYIISAQVAWKLWQSNQLVVTSYGTEHVEFQAEDRQIAPKFEQQMIKSYAKKYSGKGKAIIQTKKYKGRDVTYERYFNYKAGIGFIKIIKMVNHPHQSFDFEKWKSEGWQLITSHPTFRMEPNQQKVYGYFYTSQK